MALFTSISLSHRIFSAARTRLLFSAKCPAHLLAFFQCSSQGFVQTCPSPRVCTRAFNRIKFHFPVSECYNRVDNRIGNIAKIIG